MRYETKTYPGGYIVRDTQSNMWLAKDGTWQANPFEVMKFVSAQAALDYLVTQLGLTL